MAAIISKQQAFELAVDAVISPLTNYFVEKAYPTPHRSDLLVLSIVDGIVRRSIMIMGSKVVNHLAKKAGHIDKRGEVTNYKFFHLRNACTLAIACLTPIFYRFIGQKLNLQLPNYLNTLAYLQLNERASWIVVSTSYAFFPALANAK